MELQVGADKLVKTQSKINNKLILQHPIQYPPSSHSTIVETGATNFFVIPKTPLLNKKKKLSPFMFNYQMAHY